MISCAAACHGIALGVFDYYKYDNYLPLAVKSQNLQLAVLAFFNDGFFKNVSKIGVLRFFIDLPLLRDAAITIPPTLRSLLALVALLENKASLRNTELVIRVLLTLLLENTSFSKIFEGMFSEAVSAAVNTPGSLTKRNMELIR